MLATIAVCGFSRWLCTLQGRDSDLQPASKLCFFLSSNVKLNFKEESECSFCTFIFVIFCHAHFMMASNVVISVKFWKGKENIVTRSRIANLKVERFCPNYLLLNLLHKCSCWYLLFFFWNVSFFEFLNYHTVTAFCITKHILFCEMLVLAHKSAFNEYLASTNAKCRFLVL